MSTKPKKKVGTKKPKDEATLELEEKLKRATVKIDALERELVLRSEQTSRAIASRNELREKVNDFHSDFQREKIDRSDLVSDMTRQYKAMQEELINRINVLETAKSELTENLELAQLALDETKKEKDRIIATKDKIIAEQKQKMEEMALEFGDMLKETLDKMSERIEVSSAMWEADSGIENKERLQEFGLGHLNI
eukprot:GCRY01002637.1.p1 GENE.GCRY01002637.1~~GCRY01002637.1.p1  ORF type:complete len:195 (-),score=40.69 GCRY01002637.1:511-1095(-)